MVASAAVPTFLGLTGGQWAGLGSMLSGAGAVGSMFGGSKSKASRSKDQIYRIYDWENQAKHLTIGAKKAGLHPLYAMGMPGTSYQFQAPRTMDRGDRLGKAMHSLGQAVGSFDSRERNLRLDILKEQHRALQIENDQREKNPNVDLDSANVPVSGIKGQPNGTVVELDRVTPAHRAGTSAALGNFQQEAIKDAGNNEFWIFDTISQNLSEPLESDAPSWLKNFVQQALKVARGWQNARKEPGYGFIKKVISTKPNRGIKKKTHVERFDLNYSMWKLVPKDGVDRLFVQTEIPISSKGRSRHKVARKYATRKIFDKRRLRKKIIPTRRYRPR